MSSTLLQSFRSDSSSNIITIPVVRDAKNGKDVVRWKDIRQCFLNAHYITNGKDMIMFMTDENLEDLIPLRIAHHPGVVLEVVTLDDQQIGSSSMNNSGSAQPSVLSGSATPVGDSRALIRNPIGETRTTDSDVNTLMITDIDDRQALVIRPPLHAIQLTGERSEQQLLEMNTTMVLQEQLRQVRQQTHRMQQQMNELQQRKQEAEHQLQQRHHIDEALPRMFSQRYPLLGPIGVLIVYIVLLYLLLF
ncbi:MAG: hypothetical protein J3Q66DRAFT_344377 [Benniella sp.]|nr:MAG: hypothetical protein J3Q66DRAFT_344377 [Benniella sp.]